MPTVRPTNKMQVSNIIFSCNEKMDNNHYLCQYTYIVGDSVADCTALVASSVQQTLSSELGLENTLAQLNFLLYLAPGTVKRHVPFLLFKVSNSLQKSSEFLNSQKKNRIT